MIVSKGFMLLESLPFMRLSVMVPSLVGVHSIVFLSPALMSSKLVVVKGLTLEATARAAREPATSVEKRRMMLGNESKVR